MPGSLAQGRIHTRDWQGVSGLCVCDIGTRPPTCDLGKGLHTLFIYILYIYQFRSVSQLCLTLCNPRTAAHQASLSIINSQSLLKLMSFESVMSSNHLILCRPLPSCLRSFPASGSFPMSRLFPSGGQSYWSFSFSNEYSGLISFRIECFDLLQSKGLTRVSSSTTI